MTLQYHERFGHWFVPNQCAFVPHERGYYAVVTNSYGMRSSKEYSQECKGGGRILAFGDSFTAADGVNNEERFTDLLEVEGRAIEVLNFGLPGSGTDQQFLIYENFASYFGGDIVLICPLVENINRIAARYRPAIDRETGRTLILPKPYFTLDNGELSLHGVPVSRERLAVDEASPEILGHTDFGGRFPRISRVVNQFLYPWKDSIMRVARYDPYPQYSSPDHSGWQLMKAILHAFIDSANGREIVIVPLPTYHYIEGLSEPTYLQRFYEIEKEGPQIHLLNVLDEFKRLSYRERRACRFASDIHYTPFAHTVVARSLNSWLQSRRLI